MRNFKLGFFLIFFSCVSLVGQSIKPQSASVSTLAYKNIEVKITSNDGTNLYGIYTKPHNGQVIAHIILISGSGPQDRNGALLGHEPFLIISDRLTKAGYAVLRVDDRGAGQSEGDHNAARLQDFEDDTHAAIDFIKKFESGKNIKILLIGHSMGGILGPKIASQRNDVQGVIALAGPTLRGDQLMLLQKELIETKMGFPDQIVKMANDSFKKLYATLLEPHQNLDNAKIALARTAQDVFKMLPENQLNMIVNQLTVPWLYDMIRLDPKDYLTQLTKPALFLFGGKDLQVPSFQNNELVLTYLNKAGNTQFTTHIFEGLNHLFQHCETGLPTEYASIEQTFSEEVIDKMINWMGRMFK